MKNNASWAAIHPPIAVLESDGWHTVCDTKKCLAVCPSHAIAEQIAEALTGYLHCDMYRSAEAMENAVREKVAKGGIPADQFIESLRTKKPE